MPFWQELKRRNVVKVAAAYAIVAWLLIQGASILLPTFRAPEWVMPVFVAMLTAGLPIALIFAWAFELTPEGIRRTDAIPPQDSITHVTGQKLNYAVTALLALAVAFFFVDQYVLEPGGRGDGEPPAAAGAAPSAGAPQAGANDAPQTAAGVAPQTAAGVAPQTAAGAASQTATGPTGNAPLANSVAVIPCTNMSPRDDDAYFAAGIHEELLNQLAKLGNLNVIARTSVMQYAGTTKTIPEIARELGVESVMECSVRYADSQVLVTTQLIDAATNVHLWSESYQRAFANIFAIQADIAMNVANALQAEFSPEEQRSIEALPTDSIDAYDHYLLAQSFARQGFGRLQAAPPERADPPVRAIEEYERALAIDPDFGLARLGLAQTLNRMTLGGDPAVIARAIEAADRAIELAPTLPAALGLVAGRHLRELRWADAEQAYLDWLARAPANDYQANLAYGTFLKDVGRARDALPYLELARRMDPLLAGPSIQLTLAYDAIGDADRAVALHRSMESLVGYDFTAAGPQFWRVLTRDGIEPAREVLARAFGLETTEQVRTLIASLEGGGGVVDAFQIFDRHPDAPELGLAELRAVNDAPAANNLAGMLNVALLAAYYGDADLSVSALSKQIRNGPAALLQFAWTPLMASVRSHPGFEAMLSDVGLPGYWRGAGWPEHCRPLGASDFECD